MALTPVQISVGAAFSGLTATDSLTGVTVGNDILVVVTHGDTGGSGPSLACTETQGGTYTLDVDANGGLGTARCQIWHLPTATAGAHNISVVASSGVAGNSIGRIICLEVPPVTLDKSNTAGGAASAVAVAATAALAASGDLAIAGMLQVNLSIGGGTFPPTGGTGVYTVLKKATANQCDTDYQVLTSAAGVGANWGTITNSGKYAAMVGAYKAASTLNPIAGAATISTAGSANLNSMSGAGTIATSATAALKTGVGFNATATISAAVASVFTNYASVTLNGSPYVNFGGILDPNFWRFVQPGPTATILYDPTYITVYGNGYISSTNPNCISVVQFNDGIDWAPGLVVFVPTEVGYANTFLTATGTLTTGSLTMTGNASIALNMSANITTANNLLGPVVIALDGAASLTTGINARGNASITVSASGTLFQFFPPFGVVAHIAPGGQQFSPNPNVNAPAGRGGAKWGANGGGITPIGGGVSGQQGWDTPVIEALSRDEDNASFILNSGARQPETLTIASEMSKGALDAHTPDDSLPTGGSNAG